MADKIPDKIPDITDSVHSDVWPWCPLCRMGIVKGDKAVVVMARGLRFFAHEGCLDNISQEDKGVECQEWGEKPEDVKLRADIASFGFWAKNLTRLAALIRCINKANGWRSPDKDGWASEYKIPANLSLIHSEVSEALEAFRDDDVRLFLEEMADVVIRVLDCVGGLTVDFDAIVCAKLQKNCHRGYRHGDKRI